MDTFKLTAMTLAAGTLSLGLAVTFAAPPVSAINPAQEAVRMSILRSTMLAQTAASTQKSIASSQKATSATTPAARQKATTTTHTTGQPNQTCGSASAPTTPGNAASAPGSAFNPNGKAGMVYAGTQPQNSKNPTSVAQYDVACSHQPK